MQLRLAAHLVAPPGVTTAAARRAAAVAAAAVQGAYAAAVQGACAVAAEPDPSTCAAPLPLPARGSAPAWQRLWADEMSGSQLDATKWVPMLGNGSAFGIPGWGNNQL